MHESMSSHCAYRLMSMSGDCVALCGKNASDPFRGRGEHPALLDQRKITQHCHPDSNLVQVSYDGVGLSS